MGLETPSGSFETAYQITQNPPKLI